MTVVQDPTPLQRTDWAALADEIGTDLRAGAAERDRTGEISIAAFERFRRSGITAALVPADAGGPGASPAEMGSVLRHLGRHDAATAVALSMHSHLVATQAWRHRHGMDAGAVFRKVADEHAVLVSTGASDWDASNGAATRVDGGYRVNATKAPVSACEVGDVVVTSVRFEAGPDEPKVLHCSVPLRADGVSILRTWDTLGLRATGSHTVVLDDVFVPDAAVSMVRPADGWPPILNAVIGAALPLILAAYLGVADAAVEVARDAAGGRTESHVHQLLGEMSNAHVTAGDVVDAMFRDADDLRFEHTDAFAARNLARKTVAADALVATVRLAVEAVGGVGYSRACELERHYRDVLGVTFHPLPRAKQTRFTGRVAAGLSPI
jgi:acyl-CoA dehydrogenase